MPIIESFTHFWDGFGARMLAANETPETIARTAWHAGAANADALRELLSSPLPSEAQTALPACFTSAEWPIWHDVPKHLRDGLWHYFADHRPVGSFLTAVLSNDLFRAACYAAPDITTAHLKALMQLLDEAPRGSWGSRAAVEAWTAKEVPIVSE